MTRWTLDVAALRESPQWLPDDRLCGAETRAGYPCRGVPVYRSPSKPGRARCRMHGGRSTGPRTDAGRVAIAASNRGRAGRERQDATD